MAESLTTSTAIADDSISHNKTSHNISPTAAGTTEHDHEKKGILGKIKDKLSSSSGHHGAEQGAVVGEGGDKTHIGRDEAVKHAFGGTAVNSADMHQGAAVGTDLNREGSKHDSAI